MENNNLKNLLGDSLGKLNELKESLEKLSVASAEFAKEKADTVIQNMTNEAQQTAAKMNQKVNEMMNDEQFKNLENEGRKTVDEIQLQLTELTGKALDAVNDFSQKINAAFSKEDKNKA